MGNQNYIHHCVAVRYRINGDGDFQSGLSDLDDVTVQDLVTAELEIVTNKPVNQLANFKANRMRLTFYVENIDEYFVLRQITFYTKPISTGYPQ